MFENGLELERAKILRDKLRSIPANIRLGEDVLKTPWRRLQDVFSVTFFCLPRRLEDIIARRLANTSWRRLEDILGRLIANTSWRSLEDIFNTSWKTKSVTLKTSSRRLEDVLENKKCLLGCSFVSEGYEQLTLVQSVYMILMYRR